MNPIIYLAHFPKITRNRFNQLKGGLLNFDDWQKWEFTDLKRAHWDEQIIVEYLNWREQNSIDKICTTLEKAELREVALNDPDYPPLLAQIPDAPIALFYRGTLPNWEQPAIAVVGTRRCTSYGEQATHNLTKSLAEQGVLIVSGLALGIDGIAHQATLEVKGKTIAVLGTCATKEKISPPTHGYLAEKIIAEGGAVLSEYTPDAYISKGNFPMRNRIIAGLSLGTLVTEAPVQSGALITARLALDYNREVFAVPQPFNSERGEGCNQLLKLGARVVTKADDILEALNLKQEEAALTQTALPILSEEETKIYNLLELQTKTTDEIISDSNCPSATVNGILTMLEIKGIIKKMDGGKYGRI